MFLQMKNQYIFIKLIMVFSSLNQRYDIIILFIDWIVLSGERCGPWASCYQTVFAPEYETSCGKVTHKKWLNRTKKGIKGC